MYDAALLPQVWNTHTGEDMFTLEGHKNVVYAIAFNNPWGDKIVTGSFDKTCKLWDAYTGQLYYTLRGQFQQGWPLSHPAPGRLLRR